MYVTGLDQCLDLNEIFTYSGDPSSFGHPPYMLRVAPHLPFVRDFFCHTEVLGFDVLNLYLGF